MGKKWRRTIFVFGYNDSYDDVAGRHADRADSENGLAAYAIDVED